MFQYPDNIFVAIRQEIDDFLHNHIQIVEGYTFNQYDTIRKIHLYYNSHFTDGDYEVINNVTRKKFFYNISKWRCDVASKMIDIDVKDFMLIPNNYETELNVYLLEKELKRWLKKHRLGKILNEVARKLPIYGSVVLKKIKGGAEIVDLRNLYNEQGAESLDKARYVIIKQLMSPEALRKMKGKWDNVEAAIEKYASFVPKGYEDEKSFNVSAGTPDVEIYERYAEVPLSWFTGKETDSKKFIKSKFVVAGINDVKRDKDGNVIDEGGLILYKEKLENWPFKEVHYNKTEGRWLGIGIVEDTFEAQRRKNELMNQQLKAMEISSMLVFQTRDNVVARNLFSDVESGDILRVQTEITPLVIEERNLASFQVASREVENLADRLTFSFDVIRGETPPASATATAVITQLQQATSVFDYKRENIGLFMQEFIEDLVFPELEDRLNAEHMFRFSGSADELERIREKIAMSLIRSQMLEFIQQAGRLPTEEEIQLVKAKVKKQLRKRGDKIWLSVKKDFFANLDYYVDLVITGENRSVIAQLQNTQALLAVLAKNPDVLKHPVLKRLFFKFMSLVGMSISELELAEQEMTEIASEEGMSPLLQATAQTMQEEKPETPLAQGQSGMANMMAI